MTARISSGFDSGNIRVIAQDGDRFDLEIANDHQSDFYQWFHFRLSGARGRAVELRIVNAGGAAYPGGWPGYRARMSIDRERWLCVEDTRFDDGVLAIRLKPKADTIWIAYFAPYSIERHNDLVSRMAARPGVRHEIVGQSLDGRDLDLLTLGEGPLSVWFYARQHPGESMAEWWVEGALDRLTDAADPVARALRQAATFRIVPNMNPDGGARGHLRTNAAGVNLNREWHEPSLERSPEVFHVRNRMDKTGVDFAMDIHGDETIPHVFIAGFEGIPNWSEAQGALYHAFRDTLARRTPDFQTAHGYGIAPPGRANLSMSTNQLANRFGCIAATLEMPFKDNEGLPDPVEGWSPGRSRRLAWECLGALWELLPALGVLRGR